MSGRSRSERGAVAIEAALLTPLICLILFGIIEMSLLMRDVVSVNSSVRVGARIASVSAAAGPCVAPCTAGTAPALAQAAADAIQRAGSAMPKDSIEKVLIYESNVGGYPLPTGNTALECTSNCVTYVWNAGTDKFVYSTGTWTTSQINACVNDPNSKPVGVALIAKHAWITGLFGGTNGFQITERSIMQFEPLPFESCMPGQHP